MKKNIFCIAAHNLSILMIILPLFINQGCKKPEPVSTNSVVNGQLTSGTWKIKSVTVDGTDQSALFKNFTLLFTATSYTTSNGLPVWSATGTWSFKDDTGKIIQREDGLEITIESISSSEFIFSLTWSKSTFSGGRVNSIKGVHRFDLVK